MTLQKETRDAIGRTVRSLRGLFESEFGKQASGRFGIRSSPHGEESEVAGIGAWLDPVESLSLTPAESAQRDELIHALRYLISEGNEPGEAVARLIREAAFTAVNRLLAIRVAEAIGVLPAVLSGGRQSAGYRDTLGDLFPSLAHDEASYWTYLQVAGDELAPGVPRLFDRRHPTSAFVPSRACIDQALELLTADELASAWGEPETLGWGYQFFNGDDVKQMRDASSAPRNSRELAVRNQFFTPRYVVDWLVQNTLGRRLVQAGYELDLPLLVGEIGDHEPLALEDVRVLDPAVGSGHFLLGSYDLLEQAWQSTGVPPDHAAARILPCLFGVEIDPRAAQVAQAVLLLRARRSAPNADVTPPTIVTAVALPHSKELREQAFGGLSPAARHLADEITDALEHAPLLGSLLKVEQRLATELASHQAAPRLAADATEANVLEELHRALDELVSAAATPEQRMFSAEAADALRYLEICQQRYNTVLMNPPFGDVIPDSKTYLKAAYGNAATDVYAAFVARGSELLTRDGRLGCITPRNGLFLSSLEEWRKETVLPRLEAVLDLGLGVMHDAFVQAAAYTLAQRGSSSSASFIRLVEVADKARSLRAGDFEVRHTSRAHFRVIPGEPLAYWLPQGLLERFARDGDIATNGRVDVRQGLATADDFRFVRLFWEVNPSEVGRGKRWVPFAKGGDYSPYYADLHLVVDWEDDGARIRERGRGRVQNTTFYFRPGITWPRRSIKGFYAALVPSDAIFSHNGQMLFDADDSAERLHELLAYLNSRQVAALIEAMVPSAQYEVGAIKRLPNVELTPGSRELASALTESLMMVDAASETSHHYLHPWAVSEDAAAAVIDRATTLDAAVDGSTGLEVGSARPQSTMFAAEFFRTEFAPSLRPDVHHELSYALGVALGRWDVRVVSEVIEASSLPSPTAPVGPTVRGQLAIDDTAYPVPLPSHGLLVDDPGHDHDIISAIDGVLGLLNTASGLPDLALMDVRNLRAHLRKKFFPEHLKEYSASRRYAPIYWQLAVPSRRWGLWLYAPSLSRESLFAITRAGREKLSSLNEQIGLARERADSDRDARERAESLEDLAAEVEKFAAIADEVAQSGWEPDLNDGFVLNAAPLEELFVDKKWLGQIAQHRKAMQKGEYPWATVQRDYFEKRS